MDAADGTLKTWIARDFGLDRRLVKGLSKLGYVYPTPVQFKSIPIALQGKDVLVRAKTGSGKTVAFALPLLNKILVEKENYNDERAIRGVILVPTKELCKQIEKNITDLIYYCKDMISVCAIIDSDNESIIKFKLQSKPDIIVSTPARLVSQLKSNSIDLSMVNTLVIDEADLVLSFGYSGDVQTITSKLPKIFQGIFMSATLSPELDKFNKVVLDNPVILKVDEIAHNTESNSSGSQGQLLQFSLHLCESDKFLVLYVFLKLGLLQGKGLIFMNDVNKCYKLKLFLQQLYISAAVLSSEVPLNSRLHMLDEYNRGVFDYLIATDTTVDKGEEEEELIENTNEDEVNNNKKRKHKEKAETKTDEDDYGVVRGIDFNNVTFVINFDLPETPAAYTHRIGRTARGGASGTALSFITLTDPALSGRDREIVARDHEVLYQIRMQQPRLSNIEGDNILAAIGTDNNDDESKMQPAPLVFNMKEIETFRYRIEDVLKSVTATTIKELRLAEIRREILNSTKLKQYFQENPNDLKILRHDKAVTHPIRQKEHLKSVPEYLVPPSMRTVSNTNQTMHKRKKRKASSSTNIQQSKLKDPLMNPDVDNSNDVDDMDPNGDDNDDMEGGDDSEGVTDRDKIFVDYEKAQSGRNIWKMKHKKGVFKQSKKKNSDYVSGSYQKDKRKYAGKKR